MWIILPHFLEFNVFDFIIKKKVHNLKKLCIMLIKLIFIYLFKGRIQFIWCSRQQKYPCIMSTKKTVCKNTKLTVIGWQKKLKSLKLIHDYQIRLKHRYTDSRKHHTKLIHNIAIGICKLFIVSSFMQMIKQHVPYTFILLIIKDFFYHILWIDTLRHLFAFCHTIFKVPFCPSIPCFYSIHYHKFFKRSCMTFKVRHSP